MGMIWRGTGTVLCFLLVACLNGVWTDVVSADESKFAVRAGVRFTTPETAEVFWESSIPGESSVAFGPTRKLGTIIPSKSSATFHRVELTGLEPGRTFFYRIGTKRDGKRYFSPIYELDGRMNYSMPMIDDSGADPPGIDEVIASLKQPGGYVVLLGTEVSKRWALPLASRTKMSVVAACADAEQVQQLRQVWYRQGVYGVRLSAQLENEIPNELANVVVCESTDLVRAEQICSPIGILVTLDEPPTDSEWTWQSPC